MMGRSFTGSNASISDLCAEKKHRGFDAWKELEKKLPVLAGVARIALTSPANSSSSEKIFSQLQA